MSTETNLGIPRVYYEIPATAETLDVQLRVHNIEAHAEEFHGALKEICHAESHPESETLCPCLGHAIEAADALSILKSFDSNLSNVPFGLKEKMKSLAPRS